VIQEGLCVCVLWCVWVVVGGWRGAVCVPRARVWLCAAVCACCVSQTKAQHHRAPHQQWTGTMPLIPPSSPPHSFSSAGHTLTSMAFMTSASSSGCS
jgi:hypothetical protein